MVQTLYSLPEGSVGVVREIRLENEARRRLMDLGLTAGARVQSLFAAPSGDPRAYMVRGSVIALRQKDALAVALAENRGR